MCAYCERIEEEDIVYMYKGKEWSKKCVAIVYKRKESKKVVVYVYRRKKNARKREL
jgi:hypothetical protein